jgi:hypothetical protein
MNQTTFSIDAHVKGTMKINVKDGSEYFRGLLLLIRRDHRVTASEANMMRRVGKALGFEREFCETAIREILENKFVVDEPPRFSTRDLAIKFLSDALTLAGIYDESDGSDESWLKSFAENNGLNLERFLREKSEAARKRKDVYAPLEVEGLTVEY